MEDQNKMQDPNQGQDQSQDQDTKKDPMSEIGQISQDTTNTLISSILRKHGVTKEKMNPVSDEQKEELKNMVTNLKQQLDDLQKQSSQTITENSQSSKKAKGSKGNRRNRRV